MIRFGVLLAVILSVAFAIDQSDIDRINRLQNYWKAGHNEITAMSDGQKRRLLGTILPEKSERNYTNHIEINNNIPKTFDARQKWHYCPSIAAIKDQGDCGSCWAVSSTSAASDRLCITTHGKVKLDLSAENLLACCEDCVLDGNSGCDWGLPNKAWDYLHHTGVVTGGGYRSNEGCQPYEIPSSLLSETNTAVTPKCHKTCTNKNYKTPYNKDKHYASSSYVVPSNNIKAIQSDILRHGPVVAGFLVFNDFYAYTNGVYVQTSEDFVFAHAVKVLGWGVENGVDYWLAANSWGKNWGLDGTFKIRRGTDECGFESFIVAGLIKK